MNTYIKNIIISSALCLILLSCSPLPDDFSTFTYRDNTKALTNKNIEHVVVFGDSLSDRGNLFSIISYGLNFSDVRLQNPPASAYGLAFTNEKLLVEKIAEYFNVDLAPFYYTRLAQNKDIIITENQSNNPNFVKETQHTLANALFRPNTKGDLKNYSYEIKNLKKRTTNLGNRNIKHQATNFAIATSTAWGQYGGIFSEFTNTLSLSHQFNAFRRSGTDITIDKTLFIILIGGNDILDLTNKINKIKRNEAKHILSLATTNVINTIHKIRKMGGKRILIITPPDLSIVPFYHQNKDTIKRKKLLKRASLLSQHYENTLKKSVNKHFSAKHIAYFPTVRLSKKILKIWPSKLRHVNCVRDIAGDRFIKPELVSTSLEFETEFVNGCNQKRLENGDFPFFDEIHPSSALVKQFMKYLLPFLLKSQILQ